MAGEERVFSEFEEEEAVAEEDITMAVVVWGYMFTKGSPYSHLIHTFHSFIFFSHFSLPTSS